MKLSFIAAATLLSLSAPAFAGDAEKGEKEFRKCKACHEVVASDGTEIVKGGKTGPNLFGIVGRTAGTYEGYKYGETIIAAGAAGLVWDETNLVAYGKDPKGFLVEVTGDSGAKSKMTFKLSKGMEDIVAFLSAAAPATN